MFECNFDRLPPETAAAQYISFNKMHPEYRTCLGTSMLKLQNQCLKLLRQGCSSYIDEAMQAKCHLYLAKVHNHTKFGPTNGTSFSNLPAMQEYTACISEVQDNVKECLPEIMRPCNESKMNVFKIIRGRTPIIKHLMDANRNAYLIYSLRDPRGMILSRLHIENMMSFQDSIEANLLCQKMKEDYMDVIELEQAYPNRVKIVKYEEIAQRPLAIAKEIYSFLGYSLPESVNEYLGNATHAKKNAGVFDTHRENATATASAWKSKISKYLKTHMDTVCKDILDLAGYPI